MLRFGGFHLRSLDKRVDCHCALIKLLLTNLEMSNQLTKVDGSVLKLTTLSDCSFKAGDL